MQVHLWIHPLAFIFANIKNSIFRTNFLVKEATFFGGKLSNIYCFFHSKEMGLRIDCCILVLFSNFLPILLPLGISKIVIWKLKFFWNFTLVELSPVILNKEPTSFNGIYQSWFWPGKELKVLFWTQIVFYCLFDRNTFNSITIIVISANG